MVIIEAAIEYAKQIGATDFQKGTCTCSIDEAIEMVCSERDCRLVRYVRHGAEECSSCPSERTCFDEDMHCFKPIEREEE